MTRDDDLFVSWIAAGPQSGPISVLEDALARARTTAQRPNWHVALTGGTIAAEPGTSVLRSMTLAAAMVALVSLVVGTLVIGGIVPPDGPGPSRPIGESAAASASAGLPTSDPRQSHLGLVAYQATHELSPGEGDCQERGPARGCQISRIWVANADGSDRHPLHPNAVVGETFAGWSPDGTRLAYWSEAGLSIANDDGDLLWSFSYEDLCTDPCAGILGPSFSPDGDRLAFARLHPDNGSVIAILDLASNESRELESTRTENPADFPCELRDGCQGINDAPEWSPDGTRLAFARQSMSPEPGAPWDSAVIFVVNDDGSDLHRVSPQGFYAVDPHWSPDGSRIAFTNALRVVHEDPTRIDELTDIYVVRPDGSGLRRLTTDGRSFGADWTPDGRLTFARTRESAPDRYENWLMEVDGENPTRLGTSIADLTAAGCQICLYPLRVPQQSGPTEAHWQPGP